MKRLVVLAIAALVIMGTQFLANCASPLESTTEPDPIPPRPPDTIYDTTMFIVDHFDTVFDTTHIGDTIEYWDTVSIFDTTFSTDTFTVTDTLLDTVPFYDTSFITDTLLDTTMVYDTTLVTDTIPIFDTTYITDTLPIYDTTYITDTLPVYDTTYITDTLPIYDTTYITDTLEVTDTLTLYDTLTVVDTIYADTVCPFFMCTELHSGNMSEIWLLQNNAGNYNLHFTSDYIYWDPSKPLLIDIDGTGYVWDPMSVPVLIIDRWLDENAVITISQTPHKDANIHPVDVCVTVTPEPIE